jgi:hypothetical protein
LTRSPCSPGSWKDLTGLQHLLLGRVHVDPDDLVAARGHADRVRRAEVAGADHGQPWRTDDQRVDGLAQLGDGALVRLQVAERVARLEGGRASLAVVGDPQRGMVVDGHEIVPSRTGVRMWWGGVCGHSGVVVVALGDVDAVAVAVGG